MGFASLCSDAQNHPWCLPGTLRCLPPVSSAHSTCCQAPLPVLLICPLSYAALSIPLSFHRHLEVHLVQRCPSHITALLSLRVRCLAQVSQVWTDWKNKQWWRFWHKVFFFWSMVISSWCYVSAASPMPPSGPSESGCSLVLGYMWHPSFKRLGTAHILGVPQQKATDLVSYCLCWNHFNAVPKASRNHTFSLSKGMKFS